MAVKNSVAAITLATFDSSTLNNTYQTFTTLAEPCFLIRINNTSDVGCIISFNGGATAAEVVQAGDFVDLNFQTNAQPNGYIAKMAAGTVISIKELTDSGSGDIYLSGYYSPNSLA